MDKIENLFLSLIRLTALIAKLRKYITAMWCRFSGLDKKSINSSLRKRIDGVMHNNKQKSRNRSQSLTEGIISYASLASARVLK